jgi:hypothetical protein
MPQYAKRGPAKIAGKLAAVASSRRTVIFGTRRRRRSQNPSMSRLRGSSVSRIPMVTSRVNIWFSDRICDSSAGVIWAGFLLLFPLSRKVSF